MGGSSKQTVGYWYKVLYHAGLSRGPIDAFLEFRGGDKTAWKGGLTASGTITIDEPKLWGGDDDQGGIVSDVDVMFGEAAQVPNAYLLDNLGPQVPAWRGLSTLVFKGGRYGAMNPYPQRASYKIRKILQGWDGGAAWYPETAEILMATRLLETRYIDLDAIANAAYGSSGGQPSPQTGAGVEIVTNNPLATLTVRPNLDPDATYIAYSYWGIPAFSGGNTGSSYRFNIIREGASELNQLGVFYGYDGYEAARAAFIAEVGEVVASGAPKYTFYIKDDPISDNSGGLSLEIDISDSLLAMNPAHILYFARTDADMGREPTANINAASLTAAADTLYAEGFGICTMYDPAQESVEEFEGRITKLIDGSFSRDPISGLWHLDLARGDYVLDDLPILTDDDILEFREQPSTLDNAINSVSVTYFDPEKKETITTPPVQARGLIQDFGTIHQTIEYLEIPTAALAARVAERELRATSTPTRAFDLVCTRKPFAWRPNTYFRLQLPKRGIADMVCIVGEKSSGNLKSGAIRLKAAQDIYSMPATTFVEVEPGVDTSPSQTPVPITLQAAFEAPYIEVAATLSRADLEVLPDDAAFLLAVASAPASGIHYTMMVDAGAGYTQTARGDWCPTATVVEAASWLDTAFTLSGGTRLDEVVVGSAALWDAEIVRVDAIDPSTGAITLARACADTLPAEHAAGSRIWFYQGNEAVDPTEYSDGESLSVKLLTNTGSQQLDIALATAMAVGMGGRAVLPYPPANVQINGVYFPVALTGNPLITIDWAHRDRVLQADNLVDWLQSNIGPEPGTTYTLRLYGEEDTLLRTEAGLTGVTYEWVDEDADSGLTIPGAGVTFNEDTFDTDSTASYTQFADTAATWAISGGELVATGGSQSVFIRDGTSYTDVAVEADINHAHDGGLVLRFADNANYYLMALHDDSGAVPSKNIRLYKRLAGSFTELINADIAWARGTSKRIRFQAAGTTLTALVDGVEVWSASDSSHAGPGGVGMRNHAGQQTKFQAFRWNIQGTPSARLNGRIRAELESLRDGLTSRQIHNITVDRAGWGYNWGKYWGGL